MPDIFYMSDFYKVFAEEDLENMLASFQRDRPDAPDIRIIQDELATRKKRDICNFDLPRGTVVAATRDLPAAQVEAGAFGVVFEEANYHEVGTGPMVRWMPEWTICNVYEEDVVKVAS